MGGRDIGYSTASVFKTNISDLLYYYYYYYYYRAMSDILRLCNNDNIRSRHNKRIAFCR